MDALELISSTVVLIISVGGLATIPWKRGQWQMYTVHASFYLFIGGLAAVGLCGGF